MGALTDVQQLNQSRSFGRQRAIKWKDRLHGWTMM
jgi:hypothetical protein